MDSFELDDCCTLSPVADCKDIPKTPNVCEVTPLVCVTAGFPSSSWETSTHFKCSRREAVNSLSSDKNYAALFSISDGLEANLLRQREAVSGVIAGYFLGLGRGPLAKLDRDHQQATCRVRGHLLLEPLECLEALKAL